MRNSMIPIAAVAAIFSVKAYAASPVWTGGGSNDVEKTHAWSNTNNWSTGKIPATGDSVTLKAFDDEAITNDIAGLSLNSLSVSESGVDAPRALTFVGEPITLTGSGYSQSYGGTKPFTNWVEITDMNGLYARATDAHMMATVHFRQAQDEWYDTVNPAHSKGLYFHGHVDAPNTTLKSVTASFHFLGTYQIAAVTSGTANVTDINFEGPAGDCPSVMGQQYCDIYARQANAFPTNAVLSWNPGSSYRYIRFLGSQTVDRLQYTGTGNAWLTADYVADSDYTLRLRGTADGYAAITVTGRAGLCWDPVGDYTQTLADHEHTFYSTLSVAGGTLESAGKNTFTGVTSLNIAAGATFKISASTLNAATNPFPTADKVAATIAAGGMIDVPSGVTVLLKSLIHAGIPIKADTYTAGTDAPWLTGAGSVTVAQTAGTGWKAAVSGSWSDADKWTDGVPSLSKPAYFTLETETAYTVDLDADAVLPNTLKMNGPATLRVPTGVSKTYESATTASYSIQNGATLKVDGGEFVLTNYYGSFVISGTGVSTGKLAVAGGLFRFVAARSPSDAKVRTMDLNTCGAIEVTGGTLSVMRNCEDDAARGKAILKQNGGTFSVSGTGRYDIRPFSSSFWYNAWPTFGTGFSSLSGYSVITNTTRGFDVRPGSAGETAELLVSENATVSGSPNQRFGGQAGGTTKVVFDINGDWGLNARSSTGGSATCLHVGYGNGTTLFEQRAGYISGGPMGVTIGGSTEFKESSAGCDATYLLKGGTCCAWGHDSKGWGDLYGPMGLAVGCGYYTTTTEGRAYHGVLRIEDGTTVLSENGYTTVGGGYGRGEVVQNGGFFNSHRTYMAIGYGHGVGRYVISNGTALVSTALYLGGAPLSLCKYASDFTAAKCPWINLHDSDGTLTVAGGSFSVPSADTTLGLDGHGTIEMDGSLGQLKLKTLVMTNDAANADSGSLLRFNFDADGVSPIEADSVKLYSGAKLEINMGDYDGRRVMLVKSSDITGAFDEGDIVITGTAARSAQLRQTAKGLSVHVRRGFCIFLR